MNNQRHDQSRAVLGHRCPVDATEQAWIQESMQWFTAQFGDAPLTGPVVLPTPEFFPPPFTGSDDDVRAAVRRVAGYMGAATAITVAFTSDLADDQERLRALPVARDTRGAAGLYQQHDGSGVLTIDRSSVADPAVLLAVIAHELGHARLTGEHRISSGRKDQEPLADLLTVYLGMGIFTANAAFDFSHAGTSPARRVGGWQTHRLGYLTEQMFGYGLACYARLRGEAKPGWARYLDTNPRVYLKHGLAYLDHAAPGGGLPAAAPPG
jgi:hypothetical protein